MESKARNMNNGLFPIRGVIQANIVDTLIKQNNYTLVKLITEILQVKRTKNTGSIRATRDDAGLKYKRL